MFEYLIVRGEDLYIVGFDGLLYEITKAMKDPNYVFCAYEIHRIAVDFSIPRESSEMKHTPGPWHLTTDAYEKHRTWWIGKGDRLSHDICMVDGPVGSPDEIKANARLIAKAPDLRAALKPFAEKCPDDWRLTGKSDHPVTITVRLKHLRQARAVLADAEAGD